MRDSAAMHGRRDVEYVAHTCVGLSYRCVQGLGWLLRYSGDTRRDLSTMSREKRGRRAARFGQGPWCIFFRQILF